MRRLTVIAAVAGMLVTIVAAPAMAEKPLLMERFVDEIDDEDPGLAAECGLSTVHVEGRVQGVFKLYEGDRVFENVVGHIELTGPNGEGPVINKFGRALRGTLVSETFDPQTQLVTLVFEETTVGNPDKWLIPGVGVLVMDAGLITWTVTVVIDTSTDEVVSEDFSNVTIHGPHPIFENGFSYTDEQLAEVCAALGG
jgi:hypothetical protein